LLAEGPESGAKTYVWFLVFQVGLLGIPVAAQTQAPVPSSLEVWEATHASESEDMYDSGALDDESDALDDGPSPDAMLGSEVWLSAGVRYDRNLSINTDRIERSSSPVVEVSLYGYDQRAVRSQELRVIGYVNIDTDLEDRDRDYQAVSVQAGPVFHLSDSWDLYTSLGGGFSYYGYEYYNGSATLNNVLANRAGSLMRSVNLHLGFERIGEFYGGSDAPWVDFYATFGLDGILLDTDWIEFTPLVEYYFSDETGFEYGQLEATLGYGFPLLAGLDVEAFATGHRRHYDQAVEGFSRQRDWFALAQFGFVYSGLIWDALALEGMGRYERNWSNCEEESYDGASAGIVLHWIF
jgi:hypothetical protein